MNASRRSEGTVPRMLAASVLFLTVAGTAVPARAHEHHTDKHEPMARHLADSEMPFSGVDSLSQRTAADTAAAEAPFAMPPVMEALSHHLHNKLIHFPIVLSPLALLALFLSRRRPELVGLASAIAWLAAVSAGAALAAGLAQASDFKGETKEWLVAVHRNWGIGTTSAMTLAALMSLIRVTRRHAWILALLAVTCVSVGAYLGGLVSHG